MQNQPKIEVASLEAFSPILKEIELNSASDGELREVLARYVLRAPITEVADPFSVDYRDWVARSFAELRGVAYRHADEGLNINQENELRWGWPYGTQTASVIGPFLIAYGHIIQTMNLPAGASILELGCGTGALTLHLSRAGYRVTAVDINGSNVALVKAMTETVAFPPCVIEADITSFEPNHRFDSVIFFESFHHFLDHASLLKKVSDWLTPDGIVVFGAEPIVPEGSEAVPYPWGLRLDGESLRAMHKWGWLEIGFTEAYFFGLLTRLGFTWTRRRNPDSHWSDVIIAHLRR